MADELTARVRQAKRWQQAARARAQERVERSEKLVSKAIVSLEKYDQLEQRAMRKLGQLRPAHKKSDHDRVGMLPAMKEALASAERLVMVPQDDTAVRNLKSDLLGAVANLQFRKIVRRWRSNSSPR
jgi:hypothetical protein